MSHIRQYSLVSLFLGFFIFLSYLYQGVIIPPPLGDSHDYHMPIGQYYLTGQIFNIPKDANPYIHFPGASEIILSPFILFHIPVNWFCLLGWVVLFYLLKKLGEHFGLGSEMSMMYALAFTSTVSVLRQINTQSIDMWMGVWFVLLVLLLEKPKKTLKYFFFLGVTFGMLVGSKYTGPFYMLMLLVVYGMRLIKFINWSRILAFVIPFLLIGVSWYVRNFLAWGNPLYPIPFFIFPGKPHMESIADFILWKELLRGHWAIIFTALVSEYLMWGLSFILFLGLFFKNLKKKFIDEKTSRIFFLGFLLVISSFFMYSFKPTEYHYVVSNMRYMFPLIIMLILSMFMMAKKYKLEKEIALVALFNAIAGVSYIIYHPKLIIIFFAISAVVYVKASKQIEQFISSK